MRTRALRSLGGVVFAERTDEHCPCGDRGVVRDILRPCRRLCIACAEQAFEIAGPCCLCGSAPAAEGLMVAFDRMLFVGGACAACIAGPTHAQLAALERRAMAGHSSRQGTTAPGGTC